MIKIIYPNSEDQEPIKGSKTIFLSGTIDMGKSRDWQQEVINWFSKNIKEDITFFNPRRIVMDDSFEITYQINWELEHQENCDLNLMCILGTSKSPITLLEMGLFMKSGKLNIICEPDYYRYQNVETTCKRYGVKVYNSIEDYYVHYLSVK